MRLFFINITKLARKKLDKDLKKLAFLCNISRMYSTVHSEGILVKGINMITCLFCQSTILCIRIYFKDRIKAAKKLCEWEKVHYNQSVSEK